MNISPLYGKKDRHSNDWYLGSLTNEEPEIFKIPLSFLDQNKQHQAQIYADAEGITWTSNTDQVDIS